MFGDECANILERSINGVLNKNALLYFAYADFEEGRMKYDKVHAMYNKFLSIPDIDPTLVCKIGIPQSFVGVKCWRSFSMLHFLL